MTIAAGNALSREVDQELAAVIQRQQRRGVVVEYRAGDGYALSGFFGPTFIALAAEAGGVGRHPASRQIDETPLLEMPNCGQPGSNEGAVIFLGAFGVAEMRRRIPAQRLPRQHRRQ